MDGSWPQPTKRRSVRLPLELPVLVEQGTTRTRAHTANIGLGGAFIKTAERLAYGERIDLWVALLGPGSLSRLSSVVRWSDESGFGVQFLLLSAQDAHSLTQLMRTPARGAYTR